MYTKVLGVISVGFYVTDPLLIRYFVFVSYWRKNLTLHLLCVDFETAYFSVRIEVLYCIVT